jgi:hypothetical protein
VKTDFCDAANEFLCCQEGYQASPYYNLAVKNCLAAQLEIGNEFLGLNAEGDTLINLSVRTYEPKSFIFSA